MLSGIKKDKWKHFTVGVCMGLLFEALALHFFPTSRWAGSFIVFGFVVLICYGFELASLVFKRGHYEVLDAVAGIIGAVVGMAIIILVS
jgi:hypothetical protein